MVSRKNCAEQALAIRKALIAKYEIKDLGELDWFLDIRIIRDRGQGKLWICQDSYIEKIIHKYNLQFRKYPSTPMPIDSLTLSS
jgi:hypothetical protein